MILGHQDPEVKENIIKALDNGWTFGACEKYSLELAEYIVDKISFIDQIPQVLLSLGLVQKLWV